MTASSKVRSSLAVALAVSAVSSLTSPARAADEYVFATFKGDTAPGEKLSIYTSSDALNFTLLSDTGFTGTSGTLRDPSIMKYVDDKYYVAYTNPPTASCCGKEDHFSIASSADLIHWTHVATVAAGVTGAAHTWAPEWFIDGTSVNVIANIDTLNTDSDFKPYVFTAKDSTLSSWSGPVPLGIGPNYIDACVIKVGSTYHVFAKNEQPRLLEHATATSLTGPWKFVGVGDWAGFGSGMEGPTIVKLPDGSYRMFLDGQGNTGFLYTNSPDLNTWSKTQPIPAISNLVRHGTVIRNVALGGVSNGGGAGNAGGVGNAGGAGNAGGKSSTGGAGNAAGGSNAGGRSSAAGASSSAGGSGIAAPTGGAFGQAGSANTGGQATGEDSGGSSSGALAGAAGALGNTAGGALSSAGSIANPDPRAPSGDASGCSCELARKGNTSRSAGLIALGLLTLGFRSKRRRTRNQTTTMAP